MDSKKIDKLLKSLNELKELIKDDEEIELTDEENDEILDEFKEFVKEGINEPCEIIIKKDKKGMSNIETKCKTRIGLLVTLTNAIESIKEKYDISQFEWDLILTATGYKEE